MAKYFHWDAVFALRQDIGGTEQKLFVHAF